MPRPTRQALASKQPVLRDIQRYAWTEAAFDSRPIFLQQRRFKAAFEAYLERELPDLKKEASDPVQPLTNLD